MTIRPSLTVALAVAAVLLAGMHVANSCADAGSDVTHSSEALLRLGARFHAVTDSLKAAEMQALRFWGTADSLELLAKHNLRSDSTALNTAHSAPESLATALQSVHDLQTALRSCDQAGTFLGQAERTCHQRADSLSQRVDTLERQLGLQVRVKPPRCGFGVGAGISAASPHVDAVVGYFCRL